MINIEVDKILLHQSNIKIGKEFDKSSKRYGKTTMYPTKEYELFKSSLGKNFKEQYNNEPIEEPIALYINYSINLPKSWSKKKKLEYQFKPVVSKKVGDLDNLTKGVLDSLNNILYLDDSQIYKLVLTKNYGSTEQEKVIISIMFE